MLRGVRIGLVVALSACAKKEPPPPTSLPAPTASAADRLLPGELAEGRERAMGLAVPREMKLIRVFDDSAVARGSVAADAVSNYVRRRVDAPTAEIGAARTVFPKAHVKGQPPDRVVRIDIVETLGSTELMLRDLTPPAIPPGLSEDERWRKAGVVPGKPNDPNAL